MVTFTKQDFAAKYGMTVNEFRQEMVYQRALVQSTGYTGEYWDFGDFGNQMHRNDNDQMKFIFACIAFLVCCYLQGCISQERKPKDFVGLWKADDGAVIQLKSNGSYKANQIDYYNVYLEKEHRGRKLDLNGVWEIVKQNGKSYLELHSDATFKDVGIDKTYSQNGEVLSHRIGLTFEISNGDIFDRNGQFYFFVWIGDPNSMNKYIFVKE